jgi:hypothetical protein
LRAYLGKLITWKGATRLDNEPGNELNSDLLNYRVEQGQKIIDSQWDQWKTIDSRTQFLVALLTTLFALVLVNLGFDKFPSPFRTADGQNVSPVAFLLLISWLVATSLALLLLLREYLDNKFARPNFPSGSFSNKSDIQSAWLDLIIDSIQINGKKILDRERAIRYVYVLVFLQLQVHVMVVGMLSTGHMLNSYSWPVFLILSSPFIGSIGITYAIEPS